MTPNDLGKGSRVKLRNGFDAVLMDNKKGPIRMAEVYGLFGPEMGSVYAADMLYVMEAIPGHTLFEAYTLAKLEHTDRMLAARNAADAIFGGA